LTRKVTNPEVGGAYPKAMNTPGRRALYDNLDKDEGLALAVDAAARASRQDDWRSNSFKIKRVRNAIRAALEMPGTQVGSGSDSPYAARVREEPPAYGVKRTKPSDELVERVLELVKNQHEY
jgi:type I restriction enzyme R subunit